MNKNFDFSSVSLTVIDLNINSAPDMFVNANGVTFTKRVLEDMGYPGYVQYCVDPSRSIFAVRACKGTESRAVKFSKPAGDQANTLNCNSRALFDVVTRMIPNYVDKKRYKVEGYYDADNKIMYYDLNTAVVSMFRKNARDEE